MELIIVFILIFNVYIFEKQVFIYTKKIYIKDYYKDIRKKKLEKINSSGL
jgi:hypothetical protein